MSVIRLIWVVPTLLIASIYGAIGGSDSSTKTISVQPVRIDAIDYTTTTSTTTTTLPPTTTTLPPDPVELAYEAARLEVIANGRCVELFDAARAGGWPPELMADVLDEAWKESRCDNTIQPGHPQYNGTDHCAMQINAKVHRDYVAMVYGPMVVLANDPVACFGFAWKLYSDLDEKGRCGFKPWTRKCND